MKNKGKKVIGFFWAFLFCLTLFSQIVVFAAQDEPKKSNTRVYTVTFRAGNVGSFDTDDFSENDEIEVTENYIKVKVKKGTSVAEAAGEIWKDDKALNDWMKENVKVKADKKKKPMYAVKALEAATEKVTKNTEYVLDYARLKD